MRLPAILALLCSAVPAPAQAAEPDQLIELVRLALENNPGLQAVEEQIVALGHEEQNAGAWKNPKLSVAYQNVPVDTWALGREGMSMLAIRIEQTIPFPGKNSDREQIVRLAAEAKGWHLEEQRSQLRVGIKQAYYRLGLVRQLEALTRAHVALIERLVDVVRVKYEVGRAAQHDLLRLEVRRDQLEDELGDYAQRQVQLTAAVNRAVHRDPETLIVTPARFELRPPVVDLPALRDLAVANRPLLKQLATKEGRYQAKAALAEYEIIPDPTLFVAYGVRTSMADGSGGQDLITVGIGMPLPVFFGSRNLARAEESLALGRSVERQRSAMVDEIDSGLTDALARWQRAATKVVTYRDQLVPGAQRALDATLSSFQVDRADFTSLFDVELQLLGFEKTIRTATVAGLMARTSIELLTGRELTHGE